MILEVDDVCWAGEFREIRALVAEIDALEERALALRGRLDRAVKTNYGLLRLIQDEERALLGARDRLKRRVARAEAAIAALSDPLCRSVLNMRYLLGLPWCRVCAKLGYERTTVWRLHRRALAALDGEGEAGGRRGPPAATFS